MALTLKERLREGLRRTRERLSFGTAVDASDWDRLEEALITADVGVSLTHELLASVRARGEPSRDALRDELLLTLRDHVRQSPDPAGKPLVTMLVGVNGVGKTTTLAKLAHLASGSGESVLVIAGDTFRAAAKEQLGAWAARTGIEMVEGQNGADPAAVVHDGLQSAISKKADRVFIDTAGRLHNKKPLMDELSKIARIAGRVVDGAPHETLLVMDATVGSNGLAQASQFTESIPISGIVLTKLDGTAKGGVVFSIARQLHLPVQYVGVGESEQDLLPFVPEEFLDALLGE